MYEIIRHIHKLAEENDLLLLSPRTRWLACDLRDDKELTTIEKLRKVYSMARTENGCYNLGTKARSASNDLCRHIKARINDIEENGERTYTYSNTYSTFDRHTYRHGRKLQSYQTFQNDEGYEDWHRTSKCWKDQSKRKRQYKRIVAM